MSLSEEDIVRQIAEGDDEEGVQRAVQLVKQDRTYLPVLLRLLRKAEDWRVRYRIAKALGELGIATEDVLNALISLAEDNYMDVRRAAVESLVKLAPAVVQVLIGHLDTGNKRSVALVSEALANIGECRALPALVRAVRRFPDSDDCLESLIRLAGEHAPHYVLAAFRGIPSSARTDFMRCLLWICGRRELYAPAVLRHIWWHLSQSERQALEGYFNDEWLHRWFSHPPFEIYERFHALIRQARSEEEALARLLQAIGFPPSLHTFFNLTSMEDLTALRMDEFVAYEEVNVLRFAALMELATTRDGESIEQVINEVSEGHKAAGRLLEQEAECDRLREEIAIRRGRLRELLEEEARLLGEVEREEQGRLLERVQAEIRSTSEEIESLNRQLDGQGEGPLPMLQRETERLLPVLRERGVTFKRLVVEGVLGEYDFVEHKVTLYPPMIELAARDLLGDRLICGDVEELTAMLSTVVDMHETAHANLHLGEDSDGGQWANLTQGSVALHEGLAQFYTLALIKRVGDRQLEEAFKALSTKQPEEYNLWQVLEPCSLESVRGFVLTQRSERRLKTIFEVTAEAMQIVAVNCQWLQQRAGDEAWQAFVDQLEHIVPELQDAQSPLQLASACDQLLTACASFPAVKRLLDAILVGGFPSKEERCLLQMAAICQKPPACGAYSRTTLRAISMKAAMMEVTLSPEEIGIKQEIIKATHTVKMPPPIKREPPKEQQKSDKPSR
ncbi:MAG: HEAT repeat domain-containing protein [Thermofilaceae archaeon]